MLPQISLFLEMCQKYPELKTKVYISSIHGSFILFIHVHSTKIFQSVTLDWDETKMEDKEVQSLLTSLPGWKWKEPVFLSMVRLDLEAKLQNILEDERLIGKSLRRELYITSSFCVLEKDLPDGELPDGFVFGRLRPEHFSFIYESWSDKSFEDQNVFKEYLNFLPSVGAFKKGLNGIAVGLPVSWMMQYPYGCVGLLRTVPEMRGKGLATACMSSLLHRIGKESGKPSVMIDHGNAYSEEYHNRLGYEVKYHLGWYMYVPNHSSSLDQFIRETKKN